MLSWVKRILLAMLLLIVASILVIWWLLRGSVALLEGELPLAGLSAPLSVQRDALGVVTIDAANQADAMRALGFVHAQERYFEMDLMRRSAAGELAELVGPAALDTDKKRRMHRLRARAMRNLDTAIGDKQALLQAYTDGVNAGLADLDVKPWPYLLLRQQPKPWLPVDAILAGDAMYFDLQGSGSTNTQELALSRIQQQIPPVLFALLTRDGTAWDAPLMGEPRGDAVLPTAEQLDLRKLPMSSSPADAGLPAKPAAGSNNFAVSGALTADGRAILADDMHLGLRAPNIWFRARLRYADARAPGGKVDISGFTLPGVPGVIVGSNGHVAWGFTNSYVDSADWMRVRPCVGNTRAPTGCAPVENHRETIRVAGAEATTLDVREVSWGPILHDEPDGSALALRWVAHLPNSMNFGLADFTIAADLQQLMEIADRTALPSQNLLAVDKHGRISWRLLGALAGRTEPCSAQTLIETATNSQTSSATGDAELTQDDGKSSTSEPPKPCSPWSAVTDRSPINMDPASGRLWTANNRVMDGAELDRIGDAGYSLGARAKQIRDDLYAKDRFSERDLLAIQLDDRALFLQRWWTLLQDTAKRTDSPALQALANAASTRPERASVDSASYRLVRGWRINVLSRIEDGLTAPAKAALGKDVSMPGVSQLEGVAWPLLTQRPPHLLPRHYASCASPTQAHADFCQKLSGWDALLEDAANETGVYFAETGPLQQRTWGERNTARICHPLAAAIPLVGKHWLCMAPDQLRGDSDMPLVAGPDFGASERMVVSPGHEADGIIHMPGGQSGNPLSPFWGAGHEDWVHGRPTPFLPGKTEYSLTLKPR
ncbi:MAG: penicillin acylase family protein [Thermomonas sp.]